MHDAARSSYRTAQLGSSAKPASFSSYFTQRKHTDVRQVHMVHTTARSTARSAQHRTAATCLHSAFMPPRPVALCKAPNGGPVSATQRAAVGSQAHVPLLPCQLAAANSGRWPSLQHTTVQHVLRPHAQVTHAGLSLAIPCSPCLHHELPQPQELNTQPCNASVPAGLARHRHGTV